MVSEGQSFRTMAIIHMAAQYLLLLLPFPPFLSIFKCLLKLLEIFRKLSLFSAIATKMS